MTEVFTSPDQQDDPFNLERFLDAQENVYLQVLSELRHGQKRTHWMWFVFPQIEGLGKSSMAQHYAIKSIEEAQCYLKHPVLGARLYECVDLVLAIAHRPISEILGYPDDLKLQSSMTLFAQATDQNTPFLQVLNQYFDGEKDMATLNLL